ncbi:DUF2268 domain-containing putative Zn-dependent protease [Marinoscillum sp.]|uniref:DUF2268 domain-containing putative Zn-dependent protease n=1 Tax=Marinoscillum sp. TaxID=2024838 RepID=UPI003BACD21B
MKTLLVIPYLVSLLIVSFPAMGQDQEAVTIHYPESDLLGVQERHVIDSAINAYSNELRNLLPTLPNSIIIQVKLVPNDLSTVFGVTGRADSNDPKGELVIMISTSYPGGILAAVRDGLANVIYHELHHIAHGWTMANSHLSSSILSAAVNEGLAVVFAEQYTHQIKSANAYPPNVDEWVLDIMALPDGANYSHWVSGTNPDGRQYIGYRAGKYLIEEALKNSNYDILQLSNLDVAEIVNLAGF